MGKHFLIIIFILTSFSMSAKEADVAEIFDADSDFNITEVPEKWKNESVVILAKKVMFYYPSINSVKLYIGDGQRIRVKLMDKAAVDLFSTLYIRTYNSLRKSGAPKDSIHVKIVKPGGKEIIVTSEIGVKAGTDDIPEFFVSKYEKCDYLKLPLPNLEIGDIVDYTIFANKVFIDYSLRFPVVNEELKEMFPVVKKTFVCDFSVKFYINHVALNGSPEFSKMQSPFEECDRYIITCSDLDANKDTRWLLRFRDCQIFRFLVIVPYTENEFLGEQGKLSSKITFSKVRKMYMGANRMKSKDFRDVMYVKRMIKKHHSNVTDKKELVKWIYYYMKSDFSGYFEATMKALCKSYDIPFDMVLVVPRGLNSMDDMVSQNEAAFRPLVNNEIVLPYVKRYSHIGDHEALIEGCKAYPIRMNEADSSIVPDEIIIPVSHGSDNYLKYTFNVKPTDNFQFASVKMTKAIAGLMKNDLGPDIVKHYRWDEDKNENFGGVNDEVKIEKPVTDKEVLWILEDRRQTQLKTLYDWHYNILKREYADLESADTTRIIKNGTFINDQEIMTEDNFVLNNRFKKIGPNYSFDIGSLIAEQIKLDDHEKERDHNIWLDYAKTYEYVINLEIPEGYKVQGVEGLKYNIENFVGSFKTEVSQSGQNLKVEISKVYRSNYYPKSEWSIMTEFLDAAYNFSQKKIILVKNS